jgi:hypothetical protein
MMKKLLKVEQVVVMVPATRTKPSASSKKLTKAGKTLQ